MSSRVRLKSSVQVSVPPPREPITLEVPEGLPPTDLQRKLAGLSAPDPLTGWARPFADLPSCWNACHSPDSLLWLAARLSVTAEDRRTVVSCLAELIRQAEHGTRQANVPVERALGAAEAWARTGASRDDLLAAERAARDAAARAAASAAEESTRARMLFRSAPRGRAASFGTSRAIGALAEWREADHIRQLALAAAGVARAAAQADTADADTADEWVACVTESAGYAVGARARMQPGDRAEKVARKSARLIRRRLPCPAFD